MSGRILTPSIGAEPGTRLTRCQRTYEHGLIVMQHRRPTAQAKVSVKQAAGHFAMGASLGTVGALVLMIGHAGPFRELLAGGGSSGLPGVVFVGLSACVIAVGATATGIVLSIEEAEER